MWKEHYPVAHQICWLCDTASHSLLQLDDQIHRYQLLKVVGRWATQEKQDLLFILQPSEKVQIAYTVCIIALKLVSLRQQANNIDIHASQIGDNTATFPHHKTTQEYLLPQNSQHTRQNDKAHNIELHVNNFKEVSDVAFPFMTAEFGSLNECRKIRINTNHLKIFTLPCLEI